MSLAFQIAPVGAVSKRRSEVAPLAVRVLRSREAVEAAAPEWAALEAQANQAVLFQGIGWARAVFDHRVGRSAAFDPVIVTLRRNGELKAVLPMERLRGSGGVRLAPLGDGFQQYTDVLLAPDMAPEQAVPAMLKVAIEEAGCDFVSFPKVREDSALKRGLPRGHVRTTSGAGAPFVTLSEHADFAAYHATVTAKTRKNMRNARNRLERTAPVTHHVAQTLAETQAVIERTVTGRAQRLEEQGLTSSAFRDDGFLAFCRSLAGHADLDLLAMSLRHGGEPIAEQWGFVHGGRYYAYVASRDFTIGEESPGKLHLKEVIETAFERRLALVDLLVPAMPYKLTWASGVMEVADYAVPVSLAGRARIHLWQRMLRPLVKSTFLKLPASVRTKLMALRRG